MYIGHKKAAPGLLAGVIGGGGLRVRATMRGHARHPRSIDAEIRSFVLLRDRAIVILDARYDRGFGCLVDVPAPHIFGRDVFYTRCI